MHHEYGEVRASDTLGKHRPPENNDEADYERANEEETIEDTLLRTAFDHLLD